MANTGGNEFLFGLGNGKVSDREQRRVQRSLDRAGLIQRVTFVAADSRGIGTRYWFSTATRGAPFDQQIAAAAAQAVGRIKTQQSNGQYK